MSEANQSRGGGRLRGRGIKQYTFVGGEIDPELYARVDIPKYRESLRTCRNFTITPRGAAKNRPGTKFVREVKDSSAKCRLIPFVFSSEQAYAIELGNQYVRFHRDGGTVLAGSGSHTASTSTTVMTDSTAAFTVDALIGMTIYNTTDGSSGVITDNDATTVTVASLSGGTDNDWDTDDLYEIPYEIVSPWLTADLFRLKFAQSNDIMTVVHPDYPPYELSRLDDAMWSLSTVSVVSPVNPPTGLTHSNSWDLSDTTHPTTSWTWVVVSVDSNGRRSLASAVLTEASAVLYPDKTKPVITWTAPTAGNTPDYYEIYRGRNGVYGYVGSSDSATFTDDSDIPDYFDTPPDAYDPFSYTTTSEDSSAGGQVVLTAAASVATKVAAAEAYDDNYEYFIDISVSTGDDVTFDVEYDTGAGYVTLETLTLSAPLRDLDKVITRTHLIDGMGATDKFRVSVTAGSGSATLTKVEYSADASGGGDEIQPNYPGSVAFYEQRRFFARFSQNIQQIVASQTGDFSNFDRSSPARDDDSLDFTAGSRRMDEIRSIVGGPFGLYLFGAASEAVLRGVEGGPLTPTSFDMKTQTHYGSSWVDAIAVGNAVLFPANRDRSVREFRFARQGGEDNDAREVSIFSSHLFQYYSITQMDYADVPDPTVWVVRSDGMLLGMTYVRDQNVMAWHRHDTGGLIAGAVTDKFESVACLPEGTETATYTMVNRTIDGSTKRYIEVFAQREQQNQEDYVFLDSALQYDGTLAMDVTASGSDWDVDDTVTITAASAAFAASNVHDEVWLLDSDGTTVRFYIESWTSTTVVSGRIVAVTQSDGTPISSVPSSLQGAAAATAHLAVKSFTGLDHLEGETLGVYRDGVVGEDVTVASGAVTLQKQSSRVCIGIKIQADIESLQLELPGDYGSGRSARKVISGLAMEVDNWRGLSAGETLDDLEPVDDRNATDNYEASIPKNTLVYIYPKTTWKPTIRVALRQEDPLPVTVLSLIPEVEKGD